VRKLLSVLFLLLEGCGEVPALPPGEVVLTEGQESDTWSRDPAALTVEVEKISESGDRRHIASLAAPAKGFSLGLGAVGEYDVTGYDVNQVARVRGHSVLVDPLGLAGTKLPLFVGRVGAFSRPPSNLLTEPGEAPLLALLAGRFVFMAGGSDGSGVQTDGYDLGFWAPVADSPVILCRHEPCAFRTLAVVRNWLALAIGADWAIWHDVQSGLSGNVGLPAGMKSFAEVAGGRAIQAPDGTQYVVGATRAAPPTAAVLRVDPEGVLTRLSLTSERAGAAAAWAPGYGLVVVGGSPSGAGAELLAQEASAFTPLGYAPDPTTGAALSVLTGTTLLRAGGRQPDGSAADSVQLDLGCGTSCTPLPHPARIELDAALGFSFENATVLVIGVAPTGETAAALVSDDRVETLALREPRRGATALALPTGQVAVVGGTLLQGGAPARSLELFTPP